MSSENKKTALVVCRSEGELHLLRRMRRESGWRYVLASDDYFVQKIAERIDWVDSVCWLERMESFYNVADSVIEVIRGVNNWFRSLCARSVRADEEVHRWCNHCEGGRTSQRVQDLLLLVRSYKHVIDSYEIRRIILLKGGAALWEDEVLNEIANRRHINVETYRSRRIQYVASKLWLRLEAYARASYYLFNIVRIKLTSAKRTCERNHITFQLCSSARKHVDNVLPYMESLKVKGCRPVALCWTSRERVISKRAAVTVESYGHRADELEALLGWREILTVPWAIVRYLWRASKLKKTFIESSELKYLSVGLSALMWPSIKYYIIDELVFRERLSMAAERYFGHARPVAFKPWGNLELPEGAILTKYAKGDGTVLFSYYLGASNYNPYARKDADELVDLFFAAGPLEKELIRRDYGLTPSKIIISGKCRYEGSRRRVTESDKLGALTNLGIRDTEKRFMFYDPGSILRGYYSPVEYTLLTCSVLDYAKLHDGVTVIIKPHPSGTSDYLEGIVKRYGLSNVVLLDRRCSPDDAMLASDLLITKMSTLAIEAMLLNKVVIAVILDGEKKFKLFGDAAEYVDTPDELHTLLNRVLDDESVYSRWVSDRLEKQQGYLAQYFPMSKVPSHVVAAETIMGAISERKWSGQNYDC